jgi:hypothetical protein
VPDKNEYLIEKYTLAVNSLACGAGDINERLRNLAESVTLFDLRPGETVPAGVANNIRAIPERLTQFNDDSGRGAAAVTMERMSSQEATEIARLICDVNAALCQLD